MNYYSLSNIKYSCKSSMTDCLAAWHINNEILIPHT